MHHILYDLVGGRGGTGAGVGTTFSGSKYAVRPFGRTAAMRHHGMSGKCLPLWRWTVPLIFAFLAQGAYKLSHPGGGGHDVGDGIWCGSGSDLGVRYS